MGWGTLQDFTIDQAAGSAALVIGSIGALLTIIWQSRLPYATGVQAAETLKIHARIFKIRCDS